MIRGLAFFVFPVKDPAQARLFYEGKLGLCLTHQYGALWFEYDLGDATYAVARADATHPVPVRSAVVAFEVDDLDTAVTQLKALGVRFRQDSCETPVCRLAVALAPDFNKVLLHQRKA